MMGECQLMGSAEARGGGVGGRARKQAVVAE
jgi:hypothetical protein